MAISAGILGGAALAGGLGLGGAGLGAAGAITGGALLGGGAAALIGGSDSGGGGGGGALGSLSPGSGLLNQLLGVQLITHGHGSDKGLSEFVPTGGGIFSNLNESVADFVFNPIGFFGAEQQLIDSILGGTGLATSLEESQAALRFGLDISQQGAATGFPVDTSAAFDRALQLFERDFLPQIAETAGTRQGLSSSAFISEGSKAAQELQSQAALTQIQASENARNRQLGFLGQIPGFAGANTALPISALSDVTALGQNLRNILEEQKARPLNVFSQLSGLGNQSRFFQQGFNPSNSTAALTGGLADLAGLFGTGGLGGGSNPFAGFGGG